MVFRKLTIRARIGLTMAFLAVLLAVTGVLGLHGMTRSNESTREIYTNQMPSAVDVAVSEMFAARERLALDRAALLAGTPDSAAISHAASRIWPMRWARRSPAFVLVIVASYR